jgi:hypothetical protein
VADWRRPPFSSGTRGCPGGDITIYEADERLGGGFFLGGSAESGYNLPGSSLTRNSAARSICQVQQQCFSKVREISSGSWLTAALQHSKQLNWLIEKLHAVRESCE